ncbi:CPBP family intramembrane glutamic endopeptidase [Salinibacillus xinjiangensis]|uniref:CPBP family intramembrane metalloprotease n=1 Tax=Salinibacillus xinjiangensis TaxID=1229268 RepID=A0A6G1X6K1_9BACI|nr:type II CAAX endopeptidase family protein [Salinibacillus xinjiangensis]MRG86438.1 CPBP family intramembrane metalloprotease [Salinibacillus xinjiangensis]
MKKQLNQAELIKKITDKDLLLNLYFSQGIILFLAFVSSYFLFRDFGQWLEQLHWHPEEIFTYGVLPALLIVSIDLLLMRLLPKAYYDDGGINERIFQNQGLLHILFITFLVALSEEMLFRGVIQHEFGYIIASVTFALIHFRYLTKPVLFVSILFISFLIGYMYEMTQNLFVTIVAHFLVDFLLALFIKVKWGMNHGHTETEPK